MFLLLSSGARHHRHNSTENTVELKDKGTCFNCKHQGDCPYTDGTCSRSYYHKIYSNKKEKSIDKFVLK